MLCQPSHVHTWQACMYAVCVRCMWYMIFHGCYETAEPTFKGAGAPFQLKLTGVEYTLAC